MGYSNFDNGDHSRNTTPWGVIMMGELFQNNHHYKKHDPNFAKKWYEFDSTFVVMKALHRMKIIKFIPAPVATPIVSFQSKNLRSPKNKNLTTINN